MVIGQHLCFCITLIQNNEYALSALCTNTLAIPFKNHITQFTPPDPTRRDGLVSSGRVGRCELDIAGRSDLVVNAFDCGVTGPGFESHHGRLRLSRQPLRCTALGTGCASLLQCVG